MPRKSKSRSAAQSIAFASLSISTHEFQTLSWGNVTWLAISALTTTLSWVFYYKALKDGEVSTIALIDKGSIIVALILAWLLLGEKITWRISVGMSLILIGVFIISRR